LAGCPWPGLVFRRVGELVALTVDQVDLIYQEIIVYGSKGREERTLELGDGTAAELDA
jgi:site-specific recombinase XerD